MSPRTSRTEKAKPAAASSPDIYVGLLFVSVAALISGIVFLILELNKYDWQVAV